MFTYLKILKLFTYPLTNGVLCGVINLYGTIQVFSAGYVRALYAINYIQWLLYSRACMKACVDPIILVKSPLRIPSII